MIHGASRCAGLAVAILLAVAGCSGSASRHADHMTRGRQYLSEENFEKARVEFSNALQITPTDVEARFLSGQVAEKLGDIRGALGSWQAVVDQNPEHIGARASLGRIYVLGAAPDKAMEVVEPALAKHPDNADLLAVRAAARIQLKDPKAALDDAERAVRSDPVNENAVALLASLYRQTGDFDSAVSLLKTTLDKQPKSVDLRLVLASLYFDIKQPDLAATQFTELISLKPKVPAHRVQLAMLQTRSGKLDEAERVLKDGVEKIPDNRDMKLAYVDFLVAQRSREAGEKALQDFVARSPKDYDLQLALGTLQERFGNSKAAVATYQRVVDADKDNQSGLSARNRIAAIHVREGRSDQARKLVDEVLASNPRDSDALILRGNLALEQNQPDKAISDLRAVLRDQPDAVGVIQVLARAYLASGQTELAEEQLRSAMTLSQTNVPVRVELAQLLAQTQRVDQAITLLEDTVKGAPNDPQALENLARMYLAANRPVQATTAAENLKAVRPDLAAGFYISGLAANAQRRDADARRNLEQALKLQPSAIDALAALTRIDLAAGRLPAATARVAAVVAADANNALARNLLGELRVQAKDFAAAQGDYEAALKIAPKWWVPHRNLGMLHMARNDVPKAIAAYTAGIVATAYQANELVFDLALLHESNGKADQATALYETALSKTPGNSFLANNLAMLLATYRSDTESLNRARDISAPFGNSNNPALLDTFGWVRYKRGDNGEALAALERASELAPESSVMRYHLGMAQAKAGQGDKARQNLEKALAKTPRFMGSDEARASLAALK
jgi:tetratricopeptide (TPR) repeat protein